MKVTIMDTTLRDGEQTSGVSFTDSEKLNIAKLLLEELRVDRIEIASALVSEGEFKGAQKERRDRRPPRDRATQELSAQTGRRGTETRGLPSCHSPGKPFRLVAPSQIRRGDRGVGPG